MQTRAGNADSPRGTPFKVRISVYRTGSPECVRTDTLRTREFRKKVVNGDAKREEGKTGKDNQIVTEGKNTNQEQQQFNPRATACRHSTTGTTKPGAFQTTNGPYKVT